MDSCTAGLSSPLWTGCTQTRTCNIDVRWGKIFKRMQVWLRTQKAEDTVRVRNRQSHKVARQVSLYNSVKPIKQSTSSCT